MLTIKNSYGLDKVWSRDYLCGLNHTTGEGNFRTVIRYLCEITFMVLLGLSVLLKSSNWNYLILPLLVKHSLIFLDQVYNYCKVNCSFLDLFLTSLQFINVLAFTLVLFKALTFKLIWVFPCVALCCGVMFFWAANYPISNWFYSSFFVQGQFITLGLYMSGDISNLKLVLLPSSIVAAFFSIMMMLWVVVYIWKLVRSLLEYQLWTYLDLMLFLVLLTGPLAFYGIYWFERYVDSLGNVGGENIFTVCALLAALEVVYFGTAIFRPGLLKTRW